MRCEGAENTWRRRDDYVGTRQRLRRDAVGATSGRSFKGKRAFKGKKVKGLLDDNKITKVTGNC